MALNDFRSVNLKIDKANDYFISNQFAKEGDYNGRKLVVQLTNGGLIQDQNGVALNLGWQHQKVGNKGLDPFVVVDATQGIFEIAYPAEMMQTGNVVAVIQIIENGKIVETRNFTIQVEASPIDEDAIVSENSFTVLQNALLTVNKYDGRISNIESNKADKVEVEVFKQETTAQLEQKAQKDYVDGLIGDIGATATFKGKDTNANILAKTGMVIGDEWYGTTSLTYLRYNGTSWIDVGTDTKYGDNSVSETMLQNSIVTPNKTSFYTRESANVFDITTINPLYDNGIASIVDGVITTNSLGVNAAFHLNVNHVDNVGKGVQTLPAGTWYLKYKAKGTSGQTGVGSGIYPPRLYGSDAVRLNFVKVSGVNSLEYTDWVWSITVATDVVNYGFLIQNGSFTEVYTITDFMITDNVDAPFEDYYTYYAADNVRDRRIEATQAEVDSLSIELDSITETLQTIQSPKVLHCAFIGDSLTEGDYGSVGGTINLQPLNYPYYFKAITGWTGTNFGKSGFTTKNVWDSIVSTMNLSIKYNVVIIMLGTNAGLTDTLDVDCVGDDYTLYAATQTGSYCKIIERIMLNCPTAQIFLCTPPYNDKTGKKEYIVDTGNVVKKIAARYNLQLIDVYAGLGVNKLNKNTFLPIDLLHFGQYGYQKLGIFFASQIKSALSYYEI